MVVLQDKDIISKLGRISIPKMGSVSTEQPSIGDDDSIEKAFYAALIRNRLLSYVGINQGD
jgi:hypothetical protein